MATAINSGRMLNGTTARPAHTRIADILQHGVTRLFYAMLGAIGVLMWVLMQLPLGARAKNTLLAAMAGCIGMFALGWRLLTEQAAGLRRR